MDSAGLSFKSVGGTNPWLVRSDTLKPGGAVTIDATYTPADDNGNKIIQAGAIIGRITASGLCRECTQSVLTVAAGASDTDYYVDNAKMLVVGDEFAAVNDDGSYTTAQTITAITLGGANGDKVTVDTTLGHICPAGAACKADDGSVTPIGVCINAADVTKGDGAVTLAVRADLRSKGMPYAVNGYNKTVPAAVITSLAGLTDASITVEPA